MQLLSNSVELKYGGNVIKQGSETPFGFVFRGEDSSIIDLQSATVLVKIANEKALILEKTATIDTENTVTFYLSKEDVTGNGKMRLEFLVTFSDGRQEKFPADGWQEIRITPTLDDLTNGSVAVVTVSSIQKQIDEIAKGSTNAETSQARVNADATVTYTNLKERLDTEHKKLTSELAQMATQDKAIADGLVDDYNQLQNTLNQAANSKSRKVVLKKATYRVTNILNVPSNIEVDLNGSTILFDNVNKITIQQGAFGTGHFGVFNVHGEQTSTSTDIVSYKSVLNKENIDALRVSRFFNYLGKWGVSSTVGFSVGDFIEIKVPYEGNSINSIKPTANVLAKIEHIDGNFIYTDYYSPYNWSGFTFVSGVATIKKVNVKKNVHIHGGTIIDVAPESYRPTFQEPIANIPNRHLYPSGVGIAYAYNVRVDDMVFKDLKQSGIRQYYTHSTKLENFEMVNAKSIGGGEGYASSNMFVMNMTLEQVRGIGAPRHLVDISGGYFCQVRDCIGQATTEGAFDLHGVGEHDITFDNCVGGMTLGNTLYGFPEIGHNIRVSNSKLTVNSLGFYTNTVFENSEITLFGQTGKTDKDGVSYKSFTIPQVTFRECEVLLTEGNDGFKCNKRGQTIKSWFTFDDCEIRQSETISNGSYPLFIESYEHATITNCTVSDMGGWNYIEVKNNKKVTVNHNDVTDSIIYISAPNSTDVIDYNANHNTFTFTDYYNDKLLTVNSTIFGFDKLGSSKGVVRANGNTVISKQTISPKPIYLYAIYFGNNAGGDLDFYSSENVFRTTVDNAIGGILFDFANTTSRYTSFGNITQGKVTNSTIQQEEAYKKSVLGRYAQIIQIVGNNGYAKIGEFTATTAGHRHFIFDWISAAGTLPSAGRVVLSVNIPTLGTSTPSYNVFIANTKFGGTNDINGDDFILVETAVTSTSHTYALYVSVGASRTFSFTPILERTSVMKWSEKGTSIVATLPTGTQFIGADSNI